MTDKIKQAIQFIKNKIDDLKKENKNNEIKITVNNEDAQKQISQIEKEINSLQKKIQARQIKLDVINPQIDKILDNTRMEITPEGISTSNKALDNLVNKSLSANKEFSSLNKQAQKLYNEIEQYNRQLANAKSTMTQLKQETNQTGTSQNKLTSFFNSFKNKLQEAKSTMAQLKEQTNQTGTSQNKLTNLFSSFKAKLSSAKENIENFRKTFSKIPNIANSISNNVMKMGIGIKNGVANVLKFASSLISLNNIYSILSDTAQSWLSSQNSGAQQLSANIEYMKNTMGGVFAPVIETVINLIYKLMRGIQNVAYAFSGVNIFKDASALSMGEADGSTITPSIDFSQMDAEMSTFSQKLYEFLKPLKDSWDIYGTGLVEQLKVTAEQIGGLISSVWGSFEGIITNGTVYGILQNIFSIIGNIAEVFSNAWKNNGNGDAIIQNLSNALNKVLDTVDIIVESPLFQGILNGIIDSFKLLSDGVSFVSEKLTEFVSYFSGENQENLDLFAILIGSIATAIGLVCAALAIYNVITGIASVVTAILTSPITLVILAIAALIAIIVAIVVYWDEISTALSAGWEWLKQKAEEIFNSIAEFFKNLWQGICDTAVNIWNTIVEFVVGIITKWIEIQKAKFEFLKNIVVTVFTAVKDFFVNIWNSITTTISNVINGIKNTIQNVLNVISSIWNSIWNGLKNTVTNIFNGIWNGIKTVINWILGGIEKMGNGVVNGINTVIRALNRVSFKMPDWLGGGQFGFNIQTLNTISLPRLAKGAVLTQPTLALAGEYAGARSNPEIVTPQNIMYDTMRKALKDTEFNNSQDGQPIYLTVNVGNTKLGQILLDDLRNMKRRSGKDIEALVGG